MPNATTVPVKMAQRRDTAANWTSANPTLLAGEIGIESDTNKIKIGTGSTAWTSLTYRPWSQLSAYPIVNADIASAAGISYSKLATLSNGNIILGNSANIATSTTVSGDVTISDTGVTAIASGVIVNADINASAAIVDTKLATISTAGKVSNSATTAASANTASAIVARDASGNFTAGTITAALTGAASSNVLKAGDTMTGVLAVTAGTAALPAITPSGDPNTGIYSPGADQLAISTNGTSRLSVDSSGNLAVDTNTLYVDATNNRVGIGTTAPSQLFEIKGANARLAVNSTTVADGGILLQGNGTTYAEIKLDASSGILDIAEKQAAGNITFSTGTTPTERVRVDSSGRVGIGDTTPSVRLSVLNGTDNSDVAVFSGGDRTRGLKITTGAAGGNNDALVKLNAQNSAGQFAVLVNGSEAYRVDNSGRLGLGTSSPSEKLTVSGGSIDLPTVNTFIKGGGHNVLQVDATRTYFYGGTDGVQLRTADNASALIAITNAGLVGIGTTGPSRTLDVVGTGIYTAYTGNTGATFNIVPAANGQDGVSFVHSYQTGTGYGPLKFEINGEKMRLDSSGRLLVGTSTSPSSGELLRVEKASTGTDGTGIRLGGTYSIADGVTQTFTVGNGCLVFVSDNTTGDGGLFFCGYRSATVTLIADPNSRYANSDTSTKICVFKSANSGTVSLKNRTGGTLSFTIGKINNTD